MKKTRNIPVRFNEEMISDMELAADKMGLDNRSDLIKLCVKTFLRHFQRRGVASLPPDWQTILHEMDGRTHRYEIVTGDDLKVADRRDEYHPPRKATRRERTANNGSGS